MKREEEIAKYYEDMTQEDIDNILDGNVSCETKEDVYEDKEI